MRTRHPWKTAARRESRLARAAFVQGLAPAVRRALHAALANRILRHLPAPGVLASYAAVGDEIDPAEAERMAREAGWTLGYPLVVPGAPLTFHAAERGALQPGILGIPEPLASWPAVRPDVVLVPLLAADRVGNRLGQGGGFYDRTLAKLREEGPVLAIGLGWEVQLLERLTATRQADAWDQPLDAIATPAAFHAVSAAAKAIL